MTSKNNSPKNQTPAVPITKESQEKSWRNLEALFREHFHEPDIEAAKVVLASAAAHRITEYPPTWNMAVAVPGSMKTVILESLDGLPNVYHIDEITPQTFISGKIDDGKKQRKAPASLLHRIAVGGPIEQEAVEPPTMPNDAAGVYHFM